MARLKLSINGTTTTPESNYVAVYSKPDRRLYIQDDAASERAFVLDGDITPGFQSPEYRELTPAEIAAGELVLAATPTKPDNTLVDVRGGVALWYNLDFEVIGDRLTWAGKDSQALLEAGDWLRIIYV